MPKFAQRSFDIRPQQRIIQKRGTCVRWDKVSRCTCSDDSSRPDPSCAACHGTGYIVLGSKIIRGLVTDAMSNRILAQAGIVQSGDLMFSQMPQNRCDEVQNMDRIILLEFDQGEPFDGEHVTRNTTGDRDDLSFIVAKVLDLIVVDVDTGDVEHYIEGTDFTIDRDDIVWVGPHRPAAGAIYYIKYTANYEYVAFTPPFQRYEGSTNLGQRLLLRKRQFIEEPNPEANLGEGGLIVSP
jgi:hypothetical protein